MQELHPARFEVVAGRNDLEPGVSRAASDHRIGDEPLGHHDGVRPYGVIDKVARLAPGPEDGRLDAPCEVADLAGRGMAARLDGLEGGGDRTATLVAKDDDQGDLELHDSELEGAEHGPVHDVAGGPDREDVAEAAVEHQLGRDPGVGTAKDGDERVLAPGHLRPAVVVPVGSRRPARGVTLVAGEKAPQRMRRAVGRRVVPLSGAQGPNEGRVAGLGHRNTNQVTVAKTR